MKSEKNEQSALGSKLLWASNQIYKVYKSAEYIPPGPITMKLTQSFSEGSIFPKVIFKKNKILKVKEWLKFRNLQKQYGTDKELELTEYLTATLAREINKQIFESWIKKI